MLKAEWEKTGEAHSVGDDAIRAMAAQALPGSDLAAFDRIAGGCTNLNVRLYITSRKRPAILRIYFRDHKAARREAAISRLVAPLLIPAPETIYAGQYGDYHFALVECIEGVTLREVLLDKGEDPLCAVHDTGRYRALLQKHCFAHPGALDENAQPKAEALPDFVKFAHECLTHPFVLAQFGPQKAERVMRLMEENRALLPDPRQSFLVHGDYDPANILVRRDGAGWTVSGILDWEFASSGAWLWDVSNMLRYSHLLPPTYEGAFLEGLKDGGAALPPGWRVTMRLMNIKSLLWILRRCENGDRPKTVADICRLTDYIAGWLESPQAKAV